MTAMNQDDIDLCVKTGLSVAHCPESNTKLASGFCPTQRLMDAGVNVCLGRWLCALVCVCVVCFVLI